MILNCFSTALYSVQQSVMEVTSAVNIGKKGLTTYRVVLKMAHIDNVTIEN